MKTASYKSFVTTSLVQAKSISALTFHFNFKQLWHEVFVISGTIKVEVSVINTAEGRG